MAGRRLSRKLVLPARREAKKSMIVAGSSLLLLGVAVVGLALLALSQPMADHMCEVGEYPVKAVGGGRPEGPASRMARSRRPATCAIRRARFPSTSVTSGTTSGAASWTGMVVSCTRPAPLPSGTVSFSRARSISERREADSSPTEEPGHTRP
jgi:hypothetical protein